MTESCESGGEGTIKHTTNILEELLESEYKGLIYIDEQNRIGSYSKRAKEITGIISEDGRCHAAGVYHNKKIKPQYKYIKSYSPNGKFELKTNYLGFEIVSRIDLKRNHTAFGRTAEEEIT